MYMKLCLLSSQGWHSSDNPVTKANFSVPLQTPLGLLYQHLGTFKIFIAWCHTSRIGRNIHYHIE